MQDKLGMHKLAVSAFLDQSAGLIGNRHRGVSGWLGTSKALLYVTHRYDMRVCMDKVKLTHSSNFQIAPCYPDVPFLEICRADEAALLSLTRLGDTATVSCVRFWTRMVLCRLTRKAIGLSPSLAAWNVLMWFSNASYSQNRLSTLRSH